MFSRSKPHQEYLKQQQHSLFTLQKSIKKHLLPTTDTRKRQEIWCSTYNTTGLCQSKCVRRKLLKNFGNPSSIKFDLISTHMYKNTFEL